MYDIVEDLREPKFVELDNSYTRQAYAIEPIQTLGEIQEQIQQVQTPLEELHESVSDIECAVTGFKNRALTLLVLSVPVSRLRPFGVASVSLSSPVETRFGTITIPIALSDQTISIRRERRYNSETTTREKFLD